MEEANEEPLRPVLERRDTLDDVMDVITSDISKSPLTRILEREESVDLTALDPILDYLHEGDQDIDHCQPISINEIAGPTSQDILDLSTSPFGVYAQIHHDDLNPFGFGDHSYSTYVPSAEIDLNNIAATLDFDNWDSRPPSVLIKHYPTPSPVTASPRGSYQRQGRKISTVSNTSVSFYASDDQATTQRRRIKTEPTDSESPLDIHRVKRNRNNEAVRKSRLKKKAEMDATKKENEEMEAKIARMEARIGQLERTLQKAKEANAKLEEKLGLCKV